MPVNMDAEEMPTLELRETFHGPPQAPCERSRVPAPISHTLAQIGGPRSLLVQVQSLVEGALDWWQHQVKVPSTVQRWKLARV